MAEWRKATVLSLQVGQMKHMKVVYPCGTATDSEQLEYGPAQALSMASPLTPAQMASHHHLDSPYIFNLLYWEGGVVLAGPSSLTPQVPGHITVHTTTLRRRRMNSTLKVFTTPRSTSWHTVRNTRGVTVCHHRQLPLLGPISQLEPRTVGGHSVSALPSGWCVLGKGFCTSGGGVENDSGAWHT